jgi:hypothetical protein
MSANLAGQTRASSSNSETEWRFFGGDAGAARYSPASQITAANVRDLRVAWRWSARNFGARPATQMQISPLIVDGVMYTTAGVNRDRGHENRVSMSKRSEEEVDRVVDNLGMCPIFRHTGGELVIVTLIRCRDWRPLRAPWWRRNQVSARCDIGTTRRSARS